MLNVCVINDECCNCVFTEWWSSSRVLSWGQGHFNGLTEACQPLAQLCDHMWTFGPLTSLTDVHIQCQSPLLFQWCQSIYSIISYKHNQHHGWRWKSFTKPLNFIHVMQRQRDAIAPAEHFCARRHNSLRREWSTCLWGLCHYLLFMLIWNDTLKCRYTLLTCLLILTGIQAWTENSWSQYKLHHDPHQILWSHFEKVLVTDTLCKIKKFIKLNNMMYYKKKRNVSCCRHFNN